MSGELKKQFSKKNFEKLCTASGTTENISVLTYTNALQTIPTFEILTFGDGKASEMDRNIDAFLESTFLKL